MRKQKVKCNIGSSVLHSIMYMTLRVAILNPLFILIVREENDIYSLVGERGRASTNADSA